MPDKIILIPGLMATKLARNGKVLWPLSVGPALLADFEATLESLGLLVPGVSVAGVSMHTLDGEDQYLSFSKRFGLVEADMLGYDWRQSVDDTSDTLAEQLKEIPGRFDVVTHSTGALVFVNAFAKRVDALRDKVGRVVFVAPPFHGTLEALSCVDWSAGSASTFLGGIASLAQKLFTAVHFDPFTVTGSWSGLYDLILAPQGEQADEYPTAMFGHAVTTSNTAQVWAAANWFGAYRSAVAGHLRAASLQHAATASALKTVLSVKRPDEMAVVIATGGDTAASVGHDDLQAVPELQHWRAFPKRGEGDGTVLPASSFVAGLPIDRYFGIVADDHLPSPHGSLLSLTEIQDLLASLLVGRGATQSVLCGSELMTRVFGPR